MKNCPLCDVVERIDEPNLCVKDMVINNTWDVRKMNQLIGGNLSRELIASVGNLNQAQDPLVRFGTSGSQKQICHLHLESKV